MEAPRIWTRRPKILEARDALAFRPRMQGFYRLRTYRPDGRLHRDTGEFPNLITDSGLDIVGGSHGGSSLTNYRVGTGNVAPDVTDTGLVSQVAQTTTPGSMVSGSTVRNTDGIRWAQRSTTGRFAAPGVAYNLQEVGVAAQSGQNIFSRALIVDGEGDPVTLPWGADEALDVTYILRIYPPEEDLETEMTVSGVTYDVVVRQAQSGSWSPTGYNGSGAAYCSLASTGPRVYAYNGTIGAVTGKPSGTENGTNTPTAAAYTNGTHYRDVTTVWNLTEGNLTGGITALMVGLGGASFDTFEKQRWFQLGIVGGGTGAIPKDGTVQLALGFRHTWARR